MTDDIATSVPQISDPPTSNAPPTPAPSARMEARAAAKARRLKAIERREACFGFFTSGWTPHEIAKAMNVSAASVRRLIDQAIDDRRLDSPDRYAHVQVARLNKMYSTLDSQLERGDVRAAPTMIKVVAALDRYHGFDARYRLLALAAIGPAPVPAIAASVPLALTHAPAEAGPADAAKVAPLSDPACA